MGFETGSLYIYFKIDFDLKYPYGIWNESRCKV